MYLHCTLCVIHILIHGHVHTHVVQAFKLADQTEYQNIYKLQTVQCLGHKYSTASYCARKLNTLGSWTKVTPPPVPGGVSPVVMYFKHSIMV